MRRAGGLIFSELSGERVRHGGDRGSEPPENLDSFQSMVDQLTDLLKSPLIQLLLFSIDGSHYALRLLMVERVLPMVEVAPLPNAPAITLGVINYHGKIVAVVDLRRRLNGSSREYGLADQLVVARTPRRMLLFPVDELLGVREVAADSVAQPNTILPGIGHVEGIVALPDSILFIHDLETFLSLDEEQQLSEALAEMTT
jgi:purine-binding chemotaxis protein CheW